MDRPLDRSAPVRAPVPSPGTVLCAVDASAAAAGVSESGAVLLHKTTAVVVFVP